MFRCDGEHLFPETTTHRIRHPGKLPDQGGVTPSGRVQWFVEGADRADYGLLQFFLKDRVVTDKINRMPIDVQCFNQMWIPIGEEGKETADRFVAAGTPIGPPLNPDMAVEIAVGELSRQNEERRRKRIGIGRRRKDFGNITDLGRDRDPDVDGSAIPHLRVRRRVSRRQGRHQPIGRSGEALQSDRVGRHVHEQAVPDKDDLAEARQLFPDLLPKILQMVGRAGDEAKLGSPMPLFGPPGREGKGRRRGHLGEDMTRRDHRGVEPVLFFEDQLPHPGVIVQIPLRQNVPDDSDRLIGVPMEGLDGKNHLLPVSAAVGGCAGGEIDAEAAGPQGNPLCHRLVGEPRRPHLGREFSQKRQIGLQLFGDVGDVEGQIEIGDAVREEVMAKDRDAARSRPLRWNRFDLAGDIVDLQLRQGRSRLRRVRFRLKPFQQQGFLTDLLLFLLTEGGRDTGHPLPGLLLPLFQEGPAWFHDGEETVRIVEEPLPNNPLEEAGFLLPLLADVADDLREIHVRQGVPVIEPGVIGPSHQDDPIGIVAADHLPSVEFHLVEGALDQLPVETVFRHIPQRIQNQRLDPRSLVRIRSAQADGEGDLLQISLHAGDRRKVFSETRIDQGLPEGGRGAADEQIGDDGKHHRRRAGGVFRRHPGQVYRRFSL